MTTATPADFGTDVACLGDLDPTGREIIGLECLGQRLMNELETPRGMLIKDDPEYGLDLTDKVSRGFTPDELATLPGQIAAAWGRDERVESVRVTTRLLGSSSAFTLEVTALVKPKGAGPFRLTGLISSVKTELLEVVPL